jgi:riboflavin synthase
MFTGIIQSTGKITHLKVTAEHAKLIISPKKIERKALPLGASIAVNGICLTVINWKNNEFAVDVMPETMKRTNLSYLQQNSLVNLETSLSLNDKIDGHIVAGHIDTTVELVKKIENENSIELWFKVQSKYMDRIVEKGSIAVDGISLTVTMVKNNIFGVSLIPYTIDNTTLANYELHDQANLETDMIGRYVVKQIQVWKKNFNG